MAQSVRWSNQTQKSYPASRLFNIKHTNTCEAQVEKREVRDPHLRAPGPSLLMSMHFEISKYYMQAASLTLKGNVWVTKHLYLYTQSHSLRDTFCGVLYPKSIDSKSPYHKQSYTDQVQPAKNIPRVRTVLLVTISAIISDMPRDL